MTVERALRCPGRHLRAALAGPRLAGSTPASTSFTAFVGRNLLQSAFTNGCPAMWIFRKLGLKDAPRAGGQVALP